MQIKAFDINLYIYLHLREEEGWVNFGIQNYFSHFIIWQTNMKLRQEVLFIYLNSTLGVLYLFPHCFPRIPCFALEIFWCFSASLKLL